MENIEIENNKINSISFNQDFSLISLATETGFKIYNTHSLSQNYEK